MRPFFKWLELFPEPLEEMRARYENDDPNKFLLDEVKIGDKNQQFITDPIILTEPCASGNIIYKSIPCASVMYNKIYIDEKAETRFPKDPTIANYIVPDKVFNYNAHIMFIFDRIYNHHADEIENDVNSWISNLGTPIPEINSYSQLNDKFFKYSIYTNIKCIDDNGIYHNLQIEGALAIILTVLTFGQIPLANMSWKQWYDNISGNKVTRRDSNAIKVTINRLNQYNDTHGYDMIPLDIFDPDRVKFIPRLDVVEKPVLYIADYTTWVKEVDQNGNFIYGDFNKQCGTPDMDVYCKHSKQQAKVYHDIYKDFGDGFKESDSTVYEKLKAFETQREKNKNYEQ